MPSWSPIQDLNQRESQGLPELRPLFSIWKEQRERIKDSEAERLFQDKLKREWAIETGIIENLYSLDRGTTRTLIEHGIQASFISHDGSDKPPEWVVAVLKDQQEALEFVFDFVGQSRGLTTSYIKELHQLLTRNQHTTDAIDPFNHQVQVPLRRGDWKILPNNPTRTDGEIHEYAPPEHVASEMDRLLELHKLHLDDGVAPEVEAAWLHHRFTQIHPFQDGNGRMARCLASLVFIRAGGFPLVITRDHRGDYIKALEKADDGDLLPLVDLFGKVEKRWFLKALSISESVISQHTAVSQILKAASQKIADRTVAASNQYSSVFDVADLAFQKATDNLKGLQATLQKELANLPHIKAKTQFFEPGKEHWFRGQIVEIARELDYYADLQTYARWARMQIANGDQTDIVVSLHSVGARFSGVVGVTAYLQVKSPTPDATGHIQSPVPLCDEPFQITYLDSWETITERFAKWLDDIQIAALDQWQKGL